MSTRKTQKSARAPLSFATHPEEAAYWRANAAALLKGAPDSAWEVVPRSPSGRSVFADDKETARLRLALKKREDEEDGEMIRAIVRVAVAKTAKALAPRTRPSQLEEIVEDATRDALRQRRSTA